MKIFSLLNGVEMYDYDSELHSLFIVQFPLTHPTNDVD